jgi:hypothetical protein
MKNLHALERTTVLACYKIVKPQLAELVCAPNVQEAHNLSFLDATSFFAKALLIRAEMLLAFARLVRVASIRLLAHLVVGERNRRIT